MNSNPTGPPVCISSMSSISNRAINSGTEGTTSGSVTLVDMTIDPGDDDSFQTFHHHDFTISYPLNWEAEYKQTGVVRCWLDDYSELYTWYVDSERRLANPGSLSLFAQYALMYLLRRQGFHSLTWFELGANYKRPFKNEAMLDSQFAIMRRWMGAGTFEALRGALANSALGAWRGEPDLFCWEPATARWFFAEAKGRGDKLRASQFEWFSVCHTACPDIDIRVYSLKPE